MRRDHLTLRAAVVTVLLAAGAAASTPLAAQWTAPPSDSVTRILTERIERGGAAGLVLGVVQGGRARVMVAGRRAGAWGRFSSAYSTMASSAC